MFKKGSLFWRSHIIKTITNIDKYFTLQLQGEANRTCTPSTSCNNIIIIQMLSFLVKMLGCTPFFHIVQFFNSRNNFILIFFIILYFYDNSDMAREDIICISVRSANLGISAEKRQFMNLDVAEICSVQLSVLIKQTVNGGLKYSIC